MVAVDVRVSDPDARIITDLAADDFDVFEDGIRQSVSLLYRVSEPGNGRGVRVLKRLKGTWTAPGPDVSAPRTRQTWIFFFDENL